MKTRIRNIVTNIRSSWDIFNKAVNGSGELVCDVNELNNVFFDNS